MTPKINHESRRQRREEIAGEIRLGSSPEDVMKMFSVTSQTLRVACRSYGVKLPKLQSNAAAKNKKSRDHRLLNIIYRLINTPKSYAEIGRELGITRSAVQRVAKLCEEYDIKMKERKRAKKTT